MSKISLTDKLLGQQQKIPLIETIPLLEQWFSYGCGKDLLSAEKTEVDAILEKLFGYYLLQLSTSRDVVLHNSSKIKHCFSLSPASGGNVKAVCDEQALPLETESIDVAVLHHVMDYSQQPHQMLKEVSRVVLPSGHVVIIGFNPFSFLGLWSLMGRLRGKAACKNHLLSFRRLADWLTLMDFSIEEVRQGYYKPPIQSLSKNKLLNAMHRFFSRHQLPFAGFYVVLAKKQSSRLTPIKPHWRIKPAILPGIEPSFYSSKDNKKTLH